MGRRKQSEVLELIAELKKARDSHPPLDEAALAAEEAPLVASLNEVGLNVASVWDLVNAKDTYPAAVSTRGGIRAHPRSRSGSRRQ